MMKLSAHGISDIGLVRQSNEDSYRVDEELGLFLVCDGMGGHAAGEVAAETAVDAAANYIRDSKSLLNVVGGRLDRRLLALGLAKGAVQKACQEVHLLSTRFPRYRGMGTTLTMLLTVDDQAVVAHVGDSRLYLLRGDRVRLLTSDHTLQNELARSGLSPTGRVNSRFGHMLTRSVGETPSVNADTEVFCLLPGDRLLLCTDGFSKYLDDDDDILGLLSGEEKDRVMARLVEYARMRGGSDNITAVVVWVAADEPHSRPSFDAARRGDSARESVSLLDRAAEPAIDAGCRSVGNGSLPIVVDLCEIS